MIPKRVATSSDYNMYNQGGLFRSSTNVSNVSNDLHSRVKTRSTMRISQVSSILPRRDQQRFGIMIERMFKSKTMGIKRQVFNFLIFRYHLTKSVLIMGSDSSKSPSAVHLLDCFESERKSKCRTLELDLTQSHKKTEKLNKVLLFQTLKQSARIWRLKVKRIKALENLDRIIKSKYLTQGFRSIQIQSSQNYLTQMLSMKYAAMCHLTMTLQSILRLSKQEALKEIKDMIESPGCVIKAITLTIPFDSPSQKQSPEIKSTPKNHHQQFMLTSGSVTSVFKKSDILAPINMENFKPKSPQQVSQTPKGFDTQAAHELFQNFNVDEYEEDQQVSNNQNTRRKSLNNSKLLVNIRHLTEHPVMKTTQNDRQTPAKRKSQQIILSRMKNKTIRDFNSIMSLTKKEIKEVVAPVSKDESKFRNQAIAISMLVIILLIIVY